MPYQLDREPATHLGTAPSNFHIVGPHQLLELDKLSLGASYVFALAFVPVH